MLERASGVKTLERSPGEPAGNAPTPIAANSRVAAPTAKAPRQPDAVIARPQAAKSEEYYLLKSQIFAALVEAIDVSQLAKLDVIQARDAIGEIVTDIVRAKKVVMSITEQDDLLRDICNDVLGYGPLEPLLARDDIADIMVNGADTVYIEVGGKVQRTDIHFRDNAQLLHICQRIVARSVDGSINPVRFATRASPMAHA